MSVGPTELRPLRHDTKSARQGKPSEVADTEGSPRFCKRACSHPVISLYPDQGPAFSTPLRHALTQDQSAAVPFPCLSIPPSLPLALPTLTLCMARLVCRWCSASRDGCSAISIAFLPPTAPAPSSHTHNLGPPPAQTPCRRLTSTSLCTILTYANSAPPTKQAQHHLQRLSCFSVFVALPCLPCSPLHPCAWCPVCAGSAPPAKTIAAPSPPRHANTNRPCPAPPLSPPVALTPCRLANISP